MPTTIKLMWFKQSGKYYTSGTAQIPDGVYMWDPEYKQAIIDTQDGLVEQWVNDEFYLMTDYDGDDEGFFTALYKPYEFEGMKKSK